MIKSNASIIPVIPHEESYFLFYFVVYSLFIMFNFPLPVFVCFLPLFLLTCVPSWPAFPPHLHCITCDSSALFPAFVPLYQLPPRSLVSSPHPSPVFLRLSPPAPPPLVSSVCTSVKSLLSRLLCLFRFFFFLLPTGPESDRSNIQH